MNDRLVIFSTIMKRIATLLETGRSLDGSWSEQMQSSILPTSKTSVYNTKNKFTLKVIELDIVEFIRNSFVHKICFIP